jgi:hypothetical protein
MSRIAAAYIARRMVRHNKDNNNYKIPEPGHSEARLQYERRKTILEVQRIKSEFEALGLEWVS